MEFADRIIPRYSDKTYVDYAESDRSPVDARDLATMKYVTSSEVTINSLHLDVEDANGVYPTTFGIDLVKCGDLVAFQVDSLKDFTAGATGFIRTAAGTIPEGYRPVDKNVSMLVLASVIPYNTQTIVNTDGSVQVADTIHTTAGHGPEYIYGCCGFWFV